MTTGKISVRLEFTPNPNTLKFVVDQAFLDRGAANFATADTAGESPLARRLFDIPGVQGVMIGTGFVTITKSPSGDWDVLAERVPAALEAHVASGEPALSPEYLARLQAPPAEGVSDVERKIRDVLDSEIRPAVAMDGGDITFDRYENGVVYLHLQGACSSCPSSVMTLKMGVESRLKDAVPEIKEVVQV